MIFIEYSKKLTKKFKPIDIIFVLKIYQNRKEIHGGSKKLSHGFEFFECYYCDKFFARGDKQKRQRHIENCSGVLGII